MRNIMLLILFNSAIGRKELSTQGDILSLLPTILLSSMQKGSRIETKRETIWRKPSFQGEATLSP
jgi:hypothetical protein